ncbi:hypothetical protein P8452_19809 [Trifolium repens]|nr:hypothetical protein P8452_19809 [Trifolium repens]
MATSAVLLRMRRAHPFLLQYRRLCSTTSSDGLFPSSVQFEKKLKQSFDTYAVHGRLLSINSRQAFIDETINNNLEGNINHLNRLMHLKELLAKQDEATAELNNYKLTYLTSITTRLPPQEPFIYGGGRLLSELLCWRMKELKWNSKSNFNPTMLLNPLEVICEKLKIFNPSTNQVDVLFKIFSESDEPPHLVEGWQNKWLELYETWNQSKDRLMNHDDELGLASNLKILCERVNILNRVMRLKDMLLKEDELSAELTISRVTSLQEIITNLPPSLAQWERRLLNGRLTDLIYMELDEAMVFALRSNGGRPIPSKFPPKRILKLRPSPLTPACRIVYGFWLNPPQTAISKHASHIVLERECC